MNQLGHFIGQHLFRFVDFFVFVRSQTADFLHRQEGQQRQAFFHVRVVHIAPVLIEIIRRTFFRIQPQGALFRFAHFAAVTGGKQLTGNAESRFLVFAANQFHTGQHVGPLVVAAHFQHTVIVLMQRIKIIRLHDHVVKLKERQALVPTFLIALGRQHVVHGKMRAHFPQQVHVI